ncbi:MAG: hypothetical protein U0359_03020 [Byssovorax sp.]
MSVDLDPPREPRPSALRRPGLVLVTALYRLVAGALVAAPIASLLHTTVASYPRGDAELFDPGGIMLLEAVRFGQRAASPALTGAGLPALIAIALGLLPFAMLVAGMGRKGPLSRAFLVHAAFDEVGTLALLWGTGLAAQAISAALVVLLGVKAVGALHLSSKGEDIGNIVLAVLAALVVVVAGVARDLAMVAAADGGSRFYVSASRGLRAIRRAPLRMLLAYGWRALLAAGLYVAAFHFGPPGTTNLGRSFGMHEGAIVLGVFLHASWLATAIVLLRETAPIDVPEPAPAREEVGAADVNEPAVAEVIEPAPIEAVPVPEEPAPAIEAGEAPPAEEEEPADPAPSDPPPGDRSPS